MPAGNDFHQPAPGSYRAGHHRRDWPSSPLALRRADFRHGLRSESGRILEALARRMPSVAHRKLHCAVTDVSLDQIAVGDLLIVFPHEICPVDGSVVEVAGAIAQEAIDVLAVVNALRVALPPKALSDY
jgi:hypothetical protein